MTLHKVAVAAKDGGGSTIAGGIQQHDTSGTGAGPNDPLLVVVDSAGAEVLGVVGDAAVITDVSGSSVGFLRGIVKLLAGTLTVASHAVTNAGTFAVQAALNAGSNLIGKVGIDQTTPGTTNKVSIGTDGTVAINAALPAGTNLIGKMGIDQTTPGTTNGVVINNANGNGSAADTGSAPVAWSTEGKAQLGSLTETAPTTDTASSGLNGRLQRVAQRLTSILAAFLPSATANGTTSSRVNSAASTNATSLKTSAGQGYEIDVFNVAAYTVFLKFYNKASAPTVGTDTPVWTIPVAAGGGYSKAFKFGKTFSTGIAYAITKLQADTDTTVVAAGDLTGSIDWI